jgi:hypothetical protein
MENTGVRVALAGWVEWQGLESLPGAQVLQELRAQLEATLPSGDPRGAYVHCYECLQLQL